MLIDHIWSLLALLKPNANRAIRMIYLKHDPLNDDPWKALKDLLGGKFSPDQKFWCSDFLFQMLSRHSASVVFSISFPNLFREYPSGILPQPQRFPRELMPVRLEVLPASKS